jgi:hypothetical protein
LTRRYELGKGREIEGSDAGEKVDVLLETVESVASYFSGDDFDLHVLIAIDFTWFVSRHTGYFDLGSAVLVVMLSVACYKADTPRPLL